MWLGSYFLEVPRRLIQGVSKARQADIRLRNPRFKICYGVQLIAHLLGGKVEKSSHREYGHGILKIRRKGSLFKGLPNKLRVWNSHGDRLSKLPEGFSAVASRKILDLPV